MVDSSCCSVTEAAVTPGGDTAVEKDNLLQRIYVLTKKRIIVK
jgi:hypothetical protein